MTEHSWKWKSILFSEYIKSRSKFSQFRFYFDIKTDMNLQQHNSIAIILKLIFHEKYQFWKNIKNIISI